MHYVLNLMQNNVLGIWHKRKGACSWSYFYYHIMDELILESYPAVITLAHY